MYIIKFKTSKTWSETGVERWQQKYKTNLIFSWSFVLESRLEVKIILRIPADWVIKLII